MAFELESHEREMLLLTAEFRNYKKGFGARPISSDSVGVNSDFQFVLLLNIDRCIDDRRLSLGSSFLIREGWAHIGFRPGQLVRALSVAQGGTV